MRAPHLRDEESLPAAVIRVIFCLGLDTYHDDDPQMISAYSPQFVVAQKYRSELASLHRGQRRPSLSYVGSDMAFSGGNPFID